MKTHVDSADFARLDDLRKIMINARAAFHGLAEDVKLMIDSGCALPERMAEMVAHLQVAVGVYVHAVNRYQQEREAMLGRMEKTDSRRLLLNVEVQRT